MKSAASRHKFAFVIQSKRCVSAVDFQSLVEDAKLGLS